MIKGFFARSLRVLRKNDLRKIFVVIAIQVGLSILDLLGVALIGILGALAVNGIQSREPSGTIAKVLEQFGLYGEPFQRQAAVIGICAACTLIGRTIISIVTTRRILHFLSARGALISSNLVGRLLSQPLTQVTKRTSQETLYALTNGVMNITLGVIGNFVTLISDFSLLVVLFIGLLFVDPLLAASTVILFSTIGITLYKMLHQKAQKLGESQALITVQSNERIVEIVQGYREAAVKNQRSYYANEISRLRFALSRDLAESAFLPYVGKYVIETTVVLGALTISAIQFALSDAAHAVAALSIFLASGTRIAPAVLRLQQGGVQLKSSLGAAGPTLDLIDELNGQDNVLEEAELAGPKFVYQNFKSEIEAVNVSFSYPSSRKLALQNVSFSVRDGEFVAIAGSSGAGKSTLADLILGLINPSQGSVTISGKPPAEAIKEWSGAIAYVPQDVIIVNGTIKENVSLGYPKECTDVEEVHRALDQAQLIDFVSSLPNGVDTQVGERGAKLSGGQRQRLGIARALYSNPRLVILDEATSALDGKTESEISAAISQLKGHVTVLMIAHRLSTIREADKIMYLENGEVVSIGTFSELKREIPSFREQAELMEL